MHKFTTFIALSGGVDSAVAAYLLKEQGHQLVGVSHIVWPESKCCSTVCLDHCRDFCQNLGMPFYKIDCIVPFCQQVVDNFVQTYQNGQTPNPCVLCNQHIRFDQMLQTLFAKQPQLNQPDYKIATGHYAQTEEKDGHIYLKRGADPAKDQSYMLYRLSQEQLRHCLFPLGKFTKAQVRELAQTWQLAAAQKKDSQDACFVETTYQAFIASYSKLTFPKGKIIDVDGKILGEHNGIPNYTRGQRKGLSLSSGPWYVIKVDPLTNTIMLGRKEDLNIQKFIITNCNWHFPNLAKQFSCTVQTRYHAKPQQCQVELQASNQAVITLAQPFHDVTSGQSAVLYQNDYVLGGGIIDSSGKINIEEF